MKRMGFLRNYLSSIGRVSIHGSQGQGAALYHTDFATLTHEPDSPNSSLEYIIYHGVGEPFGQCLCRPGYLTLQWF